MSLLREPAVAGQFYSGTAKSLTDQVVAYFDAKQTKEAAIGIVAPHAGFIYSGPVAGAVYSCLKPKGHYIIIGPNHTGMGHAFSLCESTVWKTPMAEAFVDGKLSDAIRKACPSVTVDEAAHLYEHSVEVQLPFIQHISRKFTFVPIVASDAPVDMFRRIGRAIAAAVEQCGLADDTLIVASSDMTHYESADSAKAKDTAAIKAILELDEELLLQNVSKMNISMCGYAPVAIMLVAAKQLGAKQARLVRYQNSGDTSGDFSSVVGYAGIIIK